MGMSQEEFHREMLALDNSIALAKLEVAKAEERVKEIEYRKTQFALDVLISGMKAQQQAQQNPTLPPIKGA